MPPKATVTIFPKSKLEILRKAAVPPKKAWILGSKPKDEYDEFLEVVGERVDPYEWSADYLEAAIQYVQSMEMDFLAAEHDGLAAYLREHRGGRHYILTQARQKGCMERLQTMSYVEVNLRHFYERQHGVEDHDAGRTMREALQYLCNVLEQTDEKSFALVSIH